jgi:cofilin
MMYAGSKDSIKKALQGIQIEIQGTDASEVSEEEVLNKCKAISK